MAAQMTDDERALAEARLEAFERNADELWRLLNDPYWLARHLVEVLKTGGDALIVAEAS